MDSLLWALAEAEMSTYNEETIEQYEEMRIQVSRILKKLVNELPDPVVDEDWSDRRPDRIPFGEFPHPALQARNGNDSIPMAKIPHICRVNNP